VAGSSASVAITANLRVNIFLGVLKRGSSLRGAKNTGSAHGNAKWPEPRFVAEVDAA
jgi:hypothetical protein